MKLDWSRRIRLEDQNLALHEKSRSSIPRVTIGMPTYRRAHTIRRALSSIANQTYRDFVLVISDNAGTDPETFKAVQEFASDFPEVILVAQDENLGALPNLNFLLAVAETEYFMWLADDDEITPDYLTELVGLLDCDSSTVTAMGQWRSMQSPDVGYIRPQLRPESQSRLRRLACFVAGKADDSAYYGLHRTSCLRRGRFEGYFPPNSGVLTNFCYLILFDMLLQGRFAYSDKAAWICHNYSEKHYERALGRGLTDKVKTFLRRINVYAIYTGKTARAAPWLVPFILAASVVGFLRDIAAAMLGLSRTLLTHRFTSRPSADKQ